MAKKWYAVRNGRIPGVYKSWAECEAQVCGFNGARFKGFATEHAAEVFLKGGNDLPRHKLGHEKKRIRSKVQVPKLDNPKPARSVYSGTRPPWDYPTFIECLDGEMGE